MKILIYTDNHWATNTSVLRQRGEVYSLKLENQIKSINWVNSVAKEKCDKIICLGDFFDKPELNAEELTALKEIEVREHEFIVGNHEVNSNDLKYSSAHIFSGFSKVYSQIETFSIGETQFLVLPYSTESTRPHLKDLIDTLGLDRERLIILSHNDIKDLQYGYYKSTIGYPKQDILDNCRLFINGHIHNSGTFNDKIINVGSLTGINFSNDSDRYDNRVLILDTETYEIESITNPYSLEFYKAELNTEEDVEAYLSKRSNNRSIISIKIPNEIHQQANLIIKRYLDKIVYIRTQVSYNVREETLQEQIKIDMNYFDKFKEFVKVKCEDGSGNLYLMLEELDLIGGAQ